MGQDEVMKFLRKHPNDWFTSTQISQMMKTDHNLCVNLSRLRKSKDIHWKLKAINMDDMCKYVYKYKK